MRLLFRTILLGASAVLLAQAPVTDRFLEAGMPAPSREWYAADYVEAVTVLKAGRTGLAVYGDPAGARVFKRLTARANLATYLDSRVAIGARVSQFQVLMQTLPQILSLYATGTNPETAARHRELAALFGFLLYTSEAGVKLVAELLPQIPRDGDYAARMEGLKTFNKGLTLVFQGTVQTVDDRRVYTDADIAYLLQAMEETLPTLRQVFPADYRTELRVKLGRLKTRCKDPLDKARIERMLAAVAQP